MKIVFAASECAPYAKTGGLAEVVEALPKALVQQGHEVAVYLPLYASVRRFLPENRSDWTFAIRSITIPFEYYNRFAGIVDGGLRDGVRLYFVDCPELFDREGLYGTQTGDYPNNWERFGLYCRAVIEATKQLGVPDIYHAHDWQAALISVYLRTLYYFDPVLRSAGTVLTIHNLGYQGWFPPVTTARLLFPWDIFTMEKLEQNDTFNFLKGGLVYSDMLTTVSRKYAQEIQTGEFGYGLDSLLRGRAANLRGILNGVDYAKWNPAHDGNLAAHYTPEDLRGKWECRRDLLHGFGLEQVPDATPVIGIVSRFATQKGFDLVAQIAEQLNQRDLAVVVLGSGESYYENFFRAWAARRPERVGARIGYDEALAHKVEAGADIFLMPSRYEPCGLNQIYSLKYGTVPVVRATGGLDDTIEEWDGGQWDGGSDPQTGTGTGFKFAGYQAGDLLAAIDRALTAFRDKTAWRKLMRNGMERHYGWENSAKEYTEVYEQVARWRA